MINFSIAVQVKKELEEFKSTNIKLATMDHDDSLRYLKPNKGGYYFNQGNAISLIDLYYNSIFEDNQKDKLGQRKMFLNVGKFRSEVSSKQIDFGTKDFKFTPDDYADPWTAIFMQKDFHEYAKDTWLAELINTAVEAFPKYGTVVLKKVGREMKFVPLQVLKNEQTAESLNVATYVIEEHADMYLWELQDMKSWNTDGIDLKYGECMTVYERYGYVPLSYLKKLKEEPVLAGDENRFVDSVIIMGWTKGQQKNVKDGVHIFYANECYERPYREAHWSKQHGRWLGLGVMEDLIENQRAKNIIVNLIRRSLHWSSKRVLQSASTDVAAKNLVRDVPDGAILDVGANGQITEVNLSARTNSDFNAFLNEWEHNSDQKAFTYEVSTGESMPSGTPFRLGVVLQGATNSFFKGKQERLGQLFKHATIDFLVPRFVQDMANKEKVLTMFSGETGFEVLKKAAKDLVRAEASRITLLSGKPVDANVLESAVDPFEEAQTLFYTRPSYKDAKVKFDLTITGEEVDLQTKLTSLETLYQSLAASQDPRAEKVLERITALSGEPLSQFGPPAPPTTAVPIQPNLNPNVKVAAKV